jgi:hypothetical protein
VLALLFGLLIAKHSNLMLAKHSNLMLAGGYLYGSTDVGCGPD